MPPPDQPSSPSSLSTHDSSLLHHLPDVIEVPFDNLFTPETETEAKSKGAQLNQKRKRVADVLLEKSKDGKLQHSLISKVAEEFSFTRKTKRVPVDMEKLAAIPLSRRKNMRALSFAMEVSKSTVHRWLKHKDIRRHSSAIKPYLFPFDNLFTPETETETEAKSKGAQLNQKRKRVVDVLLEKSKDDKLQHGLISKVAEEFNFTRKTVSNIWQIAKAQLESGLPIDVQCHWKGSCGRKRVPVDMEKLAAIPLSRRKNMRALSFAMEVSKSTVHRWLKCKDIRRHSSAIKPCLYLGVGWGGALSSSLSLKSLKEGMVGSRPTIFGEFLWEGGMEDIDLMIEGAGGDGEGEQPQRDG
ncbi:unnamed protein product [Cuscuta campestris]|uniref:DUF7769 domain-containing protein n=1 Tax=Cuscuta campestris TaxID=132261 RepID=A0A484K6J2_9ASTE|nr:unnamed protein product [Cuscuta campestris]